MPTSPGGMSEREMDELHEDCHKKQPEVFVRESAFDIQVGGNHYKSFNIQPTEFIHVNNLGFLQGCIIKRICRYKQKGKREDLEKAKHEIDILIELEYD